MNRLRGVLLAALALAGSGCALNLGHLHALRDAQDRFTALAADENSLALAAVFPTGTDAQATKPAGDPKGRFTPSVPTEKVQALERGYREIGEALDALQNQASADLEADKLLGSCLTLRVLSRWRAVFYAHLLRVQETSTADSGPMPPSMTNVVALAEATLKTLDERKIDLFPRDRFLLKAMKALVRYDIAYIRTTADAQADAPRWGEIAKERTKEIATADGELVKAADSEALQIRRYAFLARLVMLQTGSTLAVLGVKDTERRRELGELALRIDHLHQDYSADSGKPLRDAIRLTPAKLQELIPAFPR